MGTRARARPCPAATAPEPPSLAPPRRGAGPPAGGVGGAPPPRRDQARRLLCSPRRKSTSNLFENREDERGDVRGDPLEVRQDVEVDFRGLQRFGQSSAQPTQV